MWNDRASFVVLEWIWDIDIGLNYWECVLSNDHKNALPNICERVFGKQSRVSEAILSDTGQESILVCREVSGAYNKPVGDNQRCIARVVARVYTLSELTKRSINELLSQPGLNWRPCG